MKKNINTIRPAAVLIIAAVLFAAPMLQAQQKKKAPDVIKEKEQTEKIEVQGDPIITGAGGGYFMPMSDAGSMLKSSWCAKLFMQKNNLENTLFGFGLDVSYAALPDAKIDGAITYATVFPYITSTFKIPWDIDAQIKTGPGLTTLVSDLVGEKAFSVALTLGAGAGFYKIIGKHFFLGIETNFYYYFQLHSSMALGSYLSMGYKF